MRMRRVGARLGGWRMGTCRVLAMMATVVVVGLAASPQQQLANVGEGNSKSAIGTTTTSWSSAAISLPDAFRVVRSLTWWGVDAAMETMGYGERDRQIERQTPVRAIPRAVDCFVR